MTLRVFTAFSGYDSQCMALDRVGLEYELVGWSEIDEAAIKAHDAVYPQWAGRNFGDISEVDWDAVPGFDLFTYSFPCQAISVSGRMEGLVEGSGTTSSLLWECRKAVAAKRPKYLLMENVPTLLSEKFAPQFGLWRRTLEGLGYSNFVRALDARRFGVPQHRERIFMVSVLGCGEPYHFPMPGKSVDNLAAFLDSDVDERLYKMPNGYKRLLKLLASDKVARGNAEPMFLNVYSQSAYEGYAPTIIARVKSSNNFYIKEPSAAGGRVRFPSPGECLRLMGVSKADIGRMRAAGVKESGLYKMAGNSIVVDVLAAIFRKLFMDNESEAGEQMELVLEAGGLA